MLRARQAVSWPHRLGRRWSPDIDGLREAKPWTSREATSVKRVPASLVIIGGGVVAAEMATAYAGFGARSR